MLSPHEIAELPEAIQEIWNDFEEEILVDIAQRIIHNDEVTATAQWRYAKLKELGLQDSYIFEKLVHYANKSEKELKKLFRDTIAESLEKDNEYYAEALKQEKKKLDFQSFNEIANQGYKFTNNKIQNFTNSYAYDAKEALGKALDRIYFEVDTGVKSLDEAQKDAIDDLAKKGIGAFIVSPSGRNEQVSVVVSRAVRTGLNKTASDCQLQLAAELGCDLVEVTSHQGARPSHDLWQGKVYSISGTHSKYPSLHAATRYGYGDGLCGWNCRHSFFPFFEDISEPNERKFTKSENLAVYEYRQKKKAIENEIRKNKLSMKIKKAANQDVKAEKQKAKKLNSIKKAILGTVPAELVTVKPNIVPESVKFNFMTDKEEMRLRNITVNEIATDPTMKKAIVDYTGVDYKIINNDFLRKGKMRKYSNKWYTYNDKIEAINQAISKASLEENAILKRIISVIPKELSDLLDSDTQNLVRQYNAKGMNTDATGTGILKEELNLLEQILSKTFTGVKYQEKGFSSTTINYQKKGGLFDGMVEFEIHAQKGTNILAVEDLSKYHNEKEFILKNGTKFKIKDVKLTNVKENDRFVTGLYEIKKKDFDNLTGIKKDNWMKNLTQHGIDWTKEYYGGKIKMIVEVLPDEEETK